MSASYIKAFVQRRLREGADVETVWREAQAEFVYRVVGWNYVSRLKRELDKDEAAL